MPGARPSSREESTRGEEEVMRTAPWSAPLPRDVLAIESLGEELNVAALGVAIALEVLLEAHAKPGWLPATIDEQRVPLNGLMAPMPSFCFAKSYLGVMPIRVVRSTRARPNPSLARSPSYLARLRQRPRSKTRRCASTYHSSSSASE